MIGFSSDLLICAMLSILYIPSSRACFVLGPIGTGCPPPAIQPLLHAITSTKSYWTSPALILSSSVSAQRRPFTTAIFTVLSSSWMEASLIPSIPRIPVKLMSCRSSILLLCTRRLRTASVTPPVTPKIAAAPEDRPNGISSASGSICDRSIPASLIIRVTSVVVST